MDIFRTKMDDGVMLMGWQKIVDTDPVDEEDAIDVDYKEVDYKEAYDNLLHKYATEIATLKGLKTDAIAMIAIASVVAFATLFVDLLMF